MRSSVVLGLIACLVPACTSGHQEAVAPKEAAGCYAVQAAGGAEHYFAPLVRLSTQPVKSERPCCITGDWWQVSPPLGDSTLPRYYRGLFSAWMMYHDSVVIVGLNGIEGVSAAGEWARDTMFVQLTGHYDEGPPFSRVLGWVTMVRQTC